MGTKATDWRPGPTVCRCCLTEGCYKDISTEYFWMGKREVYAEMLSETFSLSIAYSQSGGPNSNSRLICEPCISRLRDASDFRRQVQECEKSFMQYLDPGSSVAELDVTVESMEAQVKVERVKLEKEASDDDFDDRPADFPDDDDDDDLDDQPLTKLASKIPKKESVDLMELLDSAKTGEKRKSTSKAKTPAAKKSKTKKEAKATSSKAPKPEKKKKGTENTKDSSKSSVGASDSINWIKQWASISKTHDPEKEKRLGRSSAVNIISNTVCCPFKWLNNYYMCFYCSKKYLVFSDLESHFSSEHHTDKNTILKVLIKTGRLQRIKVNFKRFSCKICGHTPESFADLKEHLSVTHKKTVDMKNDGVFPYKIDGDTYVCVRCPLSFQSYRQLNKHIETHYADFCCDQCGLGFCTPERMKSHVATHNFDKITCHICNKQFKSSIYKKAHVERVHMQMKKNRCPHCKELFMEYEQKVKHMISEHGMNPPEHKCAQCNKVFKFRGGLWEHMRAAHLKIKKYECSVCKKPQASLSVLKNHMVAHSGDRNFECAVCNKKYARKKTLKEHLRIHNNDKRFSCKFCGTAFVQNCSLKGHIKAHHRDKIKTEDSEKIAS